MDKLRLVSKAPMLKSPGDFSHRFQGEHGFPNITTLNFWPPQQRKHHFFKSSSVWTWLPFQDASMSETEPMSLNCGAPMSIGDEPFLDNLGTPQPPHLQKKRKGNDSFQTGSDLGFHPCESKLFTTKHPVLHEKLETRNASLVHFSPG